jgi:hypothetical protein
MTSRDDLSAALRRNEELAAEIEKLRAQLIQVRQRLCLVGVKVSCRCLEQSSRSFICAGELPAFRQHRGPQRGTGHGQRWNACGRFTNSSRDFTILATASSARMAHVWCVRARRGCLHSRRLTPVSQSKNGVDLNRQSQLRRLVLHYSRPLFLTRCWNLVRIFIESTYPGQVN